MSGEQQGQSATGYKRLTIGRVWRAGRDLIGGVIARWRKPSYKKVSYSQCGEDRILWNLFPSQSGFFVDVGAHHPERFSNTCIFYQRGWRGINIDPVPGTRSRFARVRPRDITLECGVSPEPGELSYYLYEDAAYNTFDEDQRPQPDTRGFPRYLGVRRVPVYPLATILDQYLPTGQQIDFLTVDAEGWDLKVLQSNDWSRYRPRVVIAEEGDADDLQTVLATSPLAAFLRQQGYTPVGWANASAIWADKSKRAAA